MLRRQFLKGVLAGLTALLLSPRKGRGTTKNIALFTCMTAGFQFHEGPNIIQRLEPGTRLRLLREADNIHDNLAVAIYTNNGKKLGYIPRTINEVPAAHLDNGSKMYAIVHNTAPNMPPWEMLEIVVMIKIEETIG